MAKFDCQGVHLDVDERTVTLLFMAPIAEDENGNDCDGAMKIKMTLKDGVKFSDISVYERRALSLAKKGQPEMGIAPGTMRLITWEEYSQFTEDNMD